MNYKITGLDRSGNRFCIHTDKYMYAMGINLYNGSVWENLNHWKLRNGIESKSTDLTRWKRVRRVRN